MWQLVTYKLKSVKGPPRKLFQAGLAGTDLFCLPPFWNGAKASEGVVALLQTSGPWVWEQCWLRIMEPQTGRHRCTGDIMEPQHGPWQHTPGPRVMGGKMKPYLFEPLLFQVAAAEQLNGISHWHNDLISINDVILRKLFLNLDIPTIGLLGKTKPCLSFMLWALQTVIIASPWLSLGQVVNIYFS